MDISCETRKPHSLSIHWKGLQILHYEGRHEGSTEEEVLEAQWRRGISWCDCRMCCLVLDGFVSVGHEMISE